MVNERAKEEMCGCKLYKTLMKMEHLPQYEYMCRGQQQDRGAQHIQLKVKVLNQVTCRAYPTPLNTVTTEALFKQPFWCPSYTLKL